MKALKNIDENNLHKSNWDLPNDRELQMRAKLNAGWSSRINAPYDNILSESEVLEIQHVMDRAAMLEKKEMQRVATLYERYNNLSKPKGNGESSCIVCATNFGLLGATPHICNGCLKNCCVTCSVDTVTTGKQTIWLCRICSGYRDFWKKSGAWFSKKFLVEGNDPEDFDKKLHEMFCGIHNGEASINEVSIVKSNLDENNCTNDIDRTLCEDGKSFALKSLKPNDEIEPMNSTEKGSDNSIEVEPVHIEKTVMSHKEKSENDLKSSTSSDKTGTDIDEEFAKYYAKKEKHDPKEEKKVIKKISASSIIHEEKSFFSSNRSINKKFLGKMKFTVTYLSAVQQLKINLLSASDLPAKDSNGLSDPYVKIHLLPGSSKATKLRSKTVYKNLNPTFNEVLTYDGVSIDDLDSKTIRLTVLDEDKIGFDYIGEYRIPLRTIRVDDVNFYDVELNEHQEFDEDVDKNLRGKICVGLKYCSKTKVFSVKIVRCAQLFPMDNGKSSDPFVEIALTPPDKEFKQKFKTSVKWKNLDPEYNEEFKFTNMEKNILMNKIVEITVWDKDLTTNDFIGAVKLGNKIKGKESKHFITAVTYDGCYYEEWHALTLEKPTENQV